MKPDPVATPGQAAPRHGILVVACGILVAWTLPGLVGHDPWKPDEAYTFGLVYHMLRSGDWVVPHLAGEPFVEKPPLFYVTATLMARSFGWLLPLHDAARLASGAWLALTFAFIAGAGRELYGRGRGLVSALVLVSCIGLLVRAHQLITDVALLGGMAAGMYGMALSLRRPALGGFWLGTGAGIGFMSKGLLAPGLLAITVVLLPLLVPAWRTRNYFLMLLIAALASIPWLGYWPSHLYGRNPDLWREWLWDNNLGRFLGHNDLGPPADPMHYLRILPWYTFPALPLALWALWHARRRLLTPGIAMPAISAVTTLIVLSVAADARELYALPLLLPMALLATPAVDTLRRGAANALYWFSIMGFTFLAGVIWFYWYALELGTPARISAHLHTLQPGYEPGFRLLPFAVAVAYTSAWFVLLLRLKRGAERPIIAWAGGLTLVWALIMTLLIGWLDIGKSYRSMTHQLVSSLPKDARCITSRALGEPQRAMLEYYAGIITIREEISGANFDCNMLLIQGDSKVEPSPGPAWVKLWEGYRPGDNVERYRLYRRGGLPPVHTAPRTSR